MTEQNDQSRRRYPRLEFGIRIFEEKDWMIKDLNPLGCFVETAKPLPVGSRIDFNFQIPLDSEYIPIQAKATVKRIEPGGMAIEFTDLEPHYYGLLEEFVAAYY